MPQPVFVKDHRVDEELALAVLTRLLLEGLAVDAGAAGAAAERIRPATVGCQVSASMCRADLEAGKTIERALEDQVREEHRRLERIADRVSQSALPLEPHVLRRAGRGLRMHEEQHAELLRL